MQDENHVLQEPKYIEKTRLIDWVLGSLTWDEIWVSIAKINEELDSPEQLTEATRVATINIMTRTILNYDKANIHGKPVGNDNPDSEGLYDMEYHPYFTNFIVYMDSSWTRAQFDQLKEMGSRWFKASLRPIPKEHKRFFSNQVRLTLWGELENSASPIKYKGRLLDISPEELDGQTINEIYDLYSMPAYTEDGKVKIALESLFANVSLSTSRVYSVGNGNMIQIGGQRCISPICNSSKPNEFQIMYDVGYHQRSHPSEGRMKYGAAVRNFHKIVPDAVFLSHWDDDHIMGCAYAQKELYDCQWFAPELTKKKYIKINAVRLATFLGYRKKLTIIRRDYNARKLVEVTNGNNKIALYLGQNRNKKPITIENCGGLVIEIVNDDGNGVITENLFCGDVPYNALSTVIWDKRIEGYSNLVVPHHGSAMDCSPLKTKKDGVATICAINDLSKNRPNKAHQDA